MVCRYCKDEFVERKKVSDKVFCSATCQKAFHRNLSKRKCSRCSLVHPSVVSGQDVCTPCLYFDQVNLEGRVLKERIEWLQAHSACFYCGEYGSEIEHVVPQCSGLPTYTVLACGECNRFASGTVYPSVLDKLEDIKRMRRKKYAKLLSMPEWTSDEISDLGYALRVRIEASNQAKELVEAQLKWSPIGMADAF